MFDRLGGLRQAGRDVNGPDVYSVFQDSKVTSTPALSAWSRMRVASS